MSGACVCTSNYDDACQSVRIGYHEVVGHSGWHRGPEGYGNNEECDITAFAEGVLHVTAFETEPAEYRYYPPGRGVDPLYSYCGVDPSYVGNDKSKYDVSACYGYGGYYGDGLTVNGKVYRGSRGPAWVKPTGVMRWSATPGTIQKAHPAKGGVFLDAESRVAGGCVCGCNAAVAAATGSVPTWDCVRGFGVARTAPR